MKTTERATASGTQLRAGAARRAPIKVLLAGSAGHALESYDFTIYAYLAVILAGQFFPADNPTASLLASFAAFGVGFLARPLGGIFFGRLGDLKGRRAVMMLTLLLMAGATLVMGLTPGYAVIGVAAPIILVVCRLVQGFSAGGEIGTAAAYLVEWAPENRRGFFGSFMQAGGAMGTIFAVTIVALCYTVLGEEAMHTWGWRIPLLLGALLGPLVVVLRRTLGETPVFANLTKRNQTSGAASANNIAASEVAVPAEVSERQDSAPAQRTKEYIAAVVRAFVFTMFWSVSFYFFLVYMPTYFQQEFGISSERSLWISMSAMTVYLFVVPATGALSDRLGRKPLVVASAVSFVVVPIVLFSALPQGAATWMLVSVAVVIGLCLSLFTGPAAATISEFFPTRTRSSGIGIGYNIATMAFGGFTPYVLTLLIDLTGNRIAPLYYIAAIGLISIPFLLTLRETSKSGLDSAE